MKLNPNVFFLVKDSTLVAWDYGAHDQYEISIDHLRVLLDESFAAGRPDLVKELRDGGILVDAAAAEPVEWGWDILSRMFHVGTSGRMIPDFKLGTEAEIARQYMGEMEAIYDRMPDAAFTYERGTPVAPAGATPDVSADLKGLIALLGRRKTSRNYAQDPIPLAELSLVLGETFRYRPHDLEDFAARGVETATWRRSSSSGGSLQSCEAYVIAKNVAGLAPGVYHYWSPTDALGFLSDLPADLDLGRMLNMQPFANGLGAAVVLTCRFEKLWWKYPHSRAYRVGLLDCGHLSQTLQLVATGLGLQTWPTGAFYDLDVSELLGLTPNGPEAPLLVVGLGGHGPPDSFKTGALPRSY